MKRLLQTACICILLSTAATAYGEQPPGLSFASLLNNVQLLPDKAIFRLGVQMQTVFVAPNTAGWIILSKADGTELMKYEFTTEEVTNPYALINVHRTTNLKTNATDTDYILNEPGAYVLKFYLEKGLFYTFPFTVEKKSSDDPFAGGDLYYMNGDWNSWGYLMIPMASPDQNLLWKMWLRQQEPGVLRKDAKIDAEVISKKDKTVICNSRDKSYTIPHDWQRFEFDMAFPEEKKVSYGQYFKAKDILAKDGDYFVKVTINGELYGIWDFSVIGGKFNYTGRTVRGTADPQTFVEGGKEAYWYQKK
jgi:hypothetical protein